MMNSFDSGSLYLERFVTRLKVRIDFLNKKSNKFSIYRLSVFITGLVICIVGFLISKELGWILTMISIISFSIIVHFHNKLLEGIRRHAVYLGIKEEHLARMNLNWEKIPDPIVNTVSEDLTIEKDLDLLGKGSLQNLIDISVSYEGSMLLRKWLTDYKPVSEKIQYRQNIIKELSALVRFRDKFLLRSKLISKKFLECEKIVYWMEKSSGTEMPVWLLPVTSILILTYLTLFLLFIFNLMSPPFWLIFLLIYFFLYSTYVGKLKPVIEESIALGFHLKKLLFLFLYIEKTSTSKSRNLSNFLKSFQNNEISANFKLKKLQRVISALIIRENPIIRLILNILFPYDIFVGIRLLKSRKEIKENIKYWIEKLNELECFISLANFAFLFPDYVYPEIENTDKNRFNVQSMGHPLIKRSNKVCNDFSLDGKNEIIIITGSNMSGKSTFLRTIGINLCLSYAGAPVNASYFNTSLYDLFTCIKVNDSVIDGISYFYAEVKRLKQLLDEFGNKDSLQKFFLIDEIFKGTNNRERLTGSRAFIKKLSELKGTGFISTHDLELPRLSEEIRSIRNYHFKEDIVKDKMEFDYKIHGGPSPTTNALKIMELSGLPVN